MKNLIKSLTLVAVLTVVGAAPTRAALIASGSFEGLAPGTTINAPQGGSSVVSTTITGWRFVDVNSPNASLTATIITNASAGTNALRLDCYYNGTGSQVYMDQWNVGMHTPVVYGHTYLVTYDVAWVSGATANNFQVNIQEFDNTGSNDGGSGGSGVVSVSAAGYKTYSFFYTPQKTNTTEIGFVLMPSPSAGTTTSVSVDNVQMVDTAALPTPPNGSFEYCPLGAAVNSGGGGTVGDASTFLGWRFFNAAPSDYTTLNAVIVTNASAGRQAIQLTAVHATTSNGGNSGLDLDNNRISVVATKTYLLSFDAALVSGTSANNLGLILAQFNSGGTFLGQPVYTFSVSSTNYHTFSVIYTPVAGTAQLVPNFQPLLNTVGSTALRLDNVQIVDLATIPLPWNGSFEYNTAGDTINAPQGGGNVVNGSTIADWRFLAQNAANASFTATIITNASAGKKALRLDLSTTAGGSSYLDQWDTPMQTPVVYGHTYMVSLDAAWISGATPNVLGIAAQEFNGSTFLTGEGIGTFSVSSANYTKSGFLWTPQNSSENTLSLVLSPGAGAISLDNIQIVDVTNLPALVNGSFEYSPIGMASTMGIGGRVDTSTFLGWRFFSVGSPAIVGFTGTIVNAGSYNGGTPGSQAMRLDINNTGSPAGNDYALDMDNNRMSVTLGKQYTLSFDMELDGTTGGTELCEVTISEFNGIGTFIGNGAIYTPTLPTDQTFHHYSVGYTPVSANTVAVNIAFRPRNPGYVSALVLDNVAFAPTPAFSGLTASPTVTYGTTGVTLAGKISVSSPTAYPTNGETITVTINGNAQTTTVNDATGDFSLTYNTGTIPYSASPYTITYFYAGSLMLGPGTNTSTTLTVNKKVLTVTGAAVTSKTYDGTTAASITGTLSGIVNSDTVTLNGTGTFASKDVANGIGGISTSTLSGAQAGNYSLTQPTGLTGNITKKALTMSGLSVPASKVYSGTTAAVVSGSPGSLQSPETTGSGTTSDGKPYSSDTVGLTGTATGTYNSKNVASATTVTYGGLSLSGAQASDYSLTIQSSAAATITQATTTNLFTSAPNPSLPGVAVTFTATVTNAVPGGPAPAGNVLFKTNGVALCDPVALNGSGVSAFVTNSLPHGSHTVVAEFAGDSNFLGSTNSVVQVVNTPPTAANSNAGVTENASLVLSVAKLLLTADDADGDALSVTAAGSTSTNGPANNVVLNALAGTITYTPATGYVGSDSFTYTVSDSYGGTAIGTVNVTVTGNGGSSPNVVVAPTYTNGAFRVTFAGIPNYEYTIQYAESPTGSWFYLKQATAGTNGLFEVIDEPLPETPARYYRTVYP